MDQFDRPATDRSAGTTEPTGRLRVGFLRAAEPARKGVIGGGFVTGVGLGGFLDGIILHQLLQWHHMASEIVPPTTMRAMAINLFADGLFSLTMWLTTVVGFALIWRNLRRDPGALPAHRVMLGWLLIGWGAFHFFDGVIFHALLGLHHIRQVENFLPYDIGFFVMGVGLVAIGLMLAREPKGLQR